MAFGYIFLAVFWWATWLIMISILSGLDFSSLLYSILYWNNYKFCILDENILTGLFQRNPTFPRGGYFYQVTQFIVSILCVISLLTIIYTPIHFNDYMWFEIGRLCSTSTSGVVFFTSDDSVMFKKISSLVCPCESVELFQPHMGQFT